MTIYRLLIASTGLFALAFSIACTTATPAQAGCADFVLSCDNGRDYPFCPRAVSPEGDVVTGTLSLAPRSAVKMRLIPMGTGYRYAGRGIWFDGMQDQALLFLRKDAAVSCSVSRQTLDPNAPAVLYTKG
jgi:hypothetical protein